MRAFDTYSEIITRGKSRAEKTGEHELGLDTDDLVMLTAAQAIALLCKYGSRPEAEKALDISKTLSSWLQQQRPTSSASATSDTQAGATLERTPTESLLSRHARAAAYRAIGQSQAHWARLTYEPSQRKDMHVKALTCLRTAADLASPPGSDPDTAVLLAAVLAESRDFISAIQVTKQALALASQSEDTDEDSVVGDPESLTREQKIAPLWHLLSLLLTARGEYENAVKVCEAAFEQLNGPDLYDDSAPPASSEKSRPATANTQALIDQMEDSVKEGLIQIRITQLALMEVLETPAAAVDASSSLLALYHKLFGSLDMVKSASPIPSAAPAATAALAPPKAGGPLKSISGSILSRSRTGRKSLDRSTFDKPVNPTTTEPSMSGPTKSGQNPTEDATPSDKHGKHHHHIPHHPFKSRGHHADGHEANDSRHPDGVSNGHDDPTATVDAAAAPEQPLRQIPHNLEHEKQPFPVGHSNATPEHDIRLPTPKPSVLASLPPRFPLLQQRRHNTSILVDIWLFIAGQYVRCELFEDAAGAIDEAQKLVGGFHEELAAEHCSAKAFDERGWGGGKSVNRLWADVYADVSSSLLSHEK